MSYGNDCGCQSDISRLQNDVRSLEYELDRVKRDADNEAHRLRESISVLQDELRELRGEVYAR